MTRSQLERRKEDHPVRVIERCKKEGRVAHVSGPMVRYSKLPFRELVRQFNTDIVYTPMILAREFVRNQVARDSDFTTNKEDRPLVIQFGANNVVDISRAARMVQPYVDGIGLNCGCPIKEQVREGIGAALMTQPQLVADMVRAVKETCGKEFCVEVKIRIHKDLDETVRFAKMVEEAGADMLTVHGRLKAQRSSTPPNLEAIKLIKDTVSIPVVANGDAFGTESVENIVKKTGVDGVMAARGILSNPAMFAGFNSTPWKAIELFWDYATGYGLPFRLIQHHFSEMLDGVLSKKEKKDMNECNSLVDLIEWFDTRFELRRRGEPGFGEDREYPWRTTYNGIP
uniref:tRNA-dihydrouridine synthase n=1 Tax=Blastobotrys adeninivorans TaxID=409370 RepID=A0A060T2F9_BLAAD